MGIAFKRKKKRNILLTFLYRFNKLLFFISSKRKAKIYLDLEWIYERLALEESEKIFRVGNNPLKFPSINFINKRINDRSVVLDMGCKNGDISSLVASIAKEVVGVDYDQKAIETARLKHKKKNLSFVNDEAFNYLNTSEKTFDTLILSHILEHIDKPQDLIEKVIQHFKQIYIEIPDFEKSILNKVRIELNNSLVYSDADHVYEYDRNEIKNLFDQCNLSVIESDFRYGVQKFWCKNKSNTEI